MRFLVLISSLLILVGSCKTVYVPTSDSNNTSDSITVKEIVKYKDSFIYVPGARQIVRIKVPCDGVLQTPNQKDSGNIIASVKNDRIKLTVTNRGNGNIDFDCEADSLKQVIKVLESNLKEVSSIKKASTQKTIIQPVEVIKYKFPRWGWLVLLYALVVTGYVFRKQLKTLFKLAIGVV